MPIEKLYKLVPYRRISLLAFFFFLPPSNSLLFFQISLIFSLPDSSKVLTSDDTSSAATTPTTPTSDLAMEDQGVGPRPICIVKTVGDHDFFLDEKNLASILMKV